MITCERCTDEAIIRAILYHPRVMSTKSMSDGVSPETWNIPVGLYLLARRDGEPMGLFLLHVQNPILLQAHVAFLPQFWGHGTAEAQRAGINWLAQNTQCKRMFCMIPEFNRAALHYVTRTGWEYEGRVRHAVVKDGQRMSEEIYGIEITYV